MTLIFGDSHFWIETFTLPRASLAGTTREDTNFTLTRAGHYLFACTSVDADLIPGNIDDVFAIAINTDDSELVPGQLLTEIRLSKFNSAGVARVFGGRLLVIMRN